MQRPAPGMKFEQAIKLMFFIEVDNIRRGLPSRISEDQFLTAMNTYVDNHSPFKNGNLSQINYVEIWSSPYIDFFDRKGKMADFYLKTLELQFSVDSLHFLHTSEYNGLPPMPVAEQNIADTMWNATRQKLMITPRTKYTFGNFSFPKNVEILHDPWQSEACTQYEKYGNMSSVHTYPAKDVMAVLILPIMKILHEGRSLYNQKIRNLVRQMLAHFVAYTFDGVRCKRLEGNDLKIPARLVTSYSRNLAMLSTLGNPGGFPDLSFNATKSFFSTEIEACTSYVSWGYTKFAYSEHVNGMNANIDYLDIVQSVMSPSTFKSLLSISSRTSSRAVVMNNELQPHLESTHSSRFESDHISFDFQDSICFSSFLWLTRREVVADIHEHCCALICDAMRYLIDSVDEYPHEPCCHRCSQKILGISGDTCPLGVTRADRDDSEQTAISIPEFGAVLKRMFTLIDI